MSQINPINSDGSPNRQTDTSIRRLFAETGFGYKEMASSRGGYVGTTLNSSFKHYGKSDDSDEQVTMAIGRIVEEYTPPSPSMKFVELRIANAPAHIHSTGKSSYKIGLRILFPDKILFNDFMFFSGNTFKYYDEKGSVYLGAIEGDISIKRSEGGTVYDVSFTLRAVKKDIDDLLEEIKYTDLNNGTKIRTKINNLAGYEGALTFSYVKDGDTILFLTVPIVMYEDKIAKIKSYMSSSDFVKYFEIYYEVRTVEFRAKKEEYADGGTIEVSGFPEPNVTTTVIDGNHYAKEYIENAAHAGLVATLDRFGKPVYTFRPDINTTRAECAVFINRLKRYLERMIRG